MAGYAGTPLPKKLGIKAGSKVNEAGKRVRIDKKTGAELADPGMVK